MMTAQEAFNRMTNDWVRFYIDEFGDEDDLKDQLNDDETSVAPGPQASAASAFLVL